MATQDPAIREIAGSVTCHALWDDRGHTATTALSGQVYPVEMKWWSRSLGRGDVASHLVRVYGRGQVGGILISNSPYPPSVIADFKDALKTKTVVFVELKEIVQALSVNRSGRELITAKIRAAAALLKEPLVYPLDELAVAW